MENRILTIFDLLFSLWGVYITFSILLYYFVSDEKLRVYLGGDIIYEKLDKNWKRFYIWGRDKSVLKSVENVYLRVQKLLKYSMILFIVLIFIPFSFFNYFTLPIFMTIIFCIWFLYSYRWVLKHAEEFKNMFLGIIKTIFYVVSISLLIYLILIYNLDLDIYKEFGIKLSENFKTDLYISTIIFSIVFFIVLILLSYFGFWVVFGILPLSLILLSFLTIKLSRNYTFFKSKWLIRLIYLNQIFLTIVGSLYMALN